MTGAAPPVLTLTGVSLRLGGSAVLDGVDWVVRADERWVVLGPNGAGKTSLLRIASLYEHPSSGSISVLGHELGRVDVRRLRIRIGLVSAAVVDLLRSGTAAADVVTSALHGALVPWWMVATDDDRSRATAQLDRFGVAHLAGHAFGTLSSGERQRVLLARAMVTGPDLLLLDEPAAGLDLGAREELLGHLTALAHDAAAPPSVLVTHHVEEIPRGTTHALLLRRGRVTASGRIDDVLTGPALTTCFGLDLAVERTDGRWSARRA